MPAAIIQPEDFQVYEIEFDRATWERVKAKVVALSPSDARYRAMAGRCIAEEVTAENLIQNHTLDNAPVRHIRPATPEERTWKTTDALLAPQRE
jgi:hypothetical protein